MMAPGSSIRSLLSFATASLPDNVVITKVTLKVKRQGVIGGGNPVTTFQGFMLDIRKGTFGTSVLQTTDFQTTAHKTVGPFSPALVGGWYEFNLTSAKAYITKLVTGSGVTQIRLRFKLDDNNNTIANYLQPLQRQCRHRLPPDIDHRILPAVKINGNVPKVSKLHMLLTQPS